MSKTVIPLTAKLVNFDTDLPFAEVISRLNFAVNKEGSENIMARFKSINTQDEFATVINDTIGDSGFLCVQVVFCHFRPILIRSNKIFRGGQATQVTRIHGRR